MTGILQVLRYAVRQLHKNPGFALAVVATLALGIGVNTAVFSLVNGFLLRPLPYPQPERLGALLLHTEEGGGVAPDEHEHFDGESWDLVRDHVPAVQAASFGQGGGNGVNLETESGAAKEIRYVKAKRVSAHYFDVLGQPMLLGREFSQEEDRRGGPPVVILSYGLWHSVFHSNREAIGKAIHLKGAPYVVVGVLPPQAQTLQPADVWTPLQPGPNGEGGGTNYQIIMRLKPGATWQEADAQLGRLRKRFFDELETKYKGHAWFYALPMERYVSRDTRSPALLLMLAVSFQPGEKWKYSNSGYVLLGYLLEKVSGEKYERFVQENIFKPLGMADSGYDSNSAVIQNRASGYSPGPDGVANTGYINMTVPFSAGGLYSTTEDLLRWEQGLWGGKLLSPASLKEMTTPFKSDYAFGLMVHTANGHQVIEHGGGIEGFNTSLAYYPADKLTVVVLGNLNGMAPQQVATDLGKLAEGGTVVLASEHKAAHLDPKNARVRG